MLCMEQEKNKLIAGNSQLQIELHQTQENWKNQREALIQDYEVRINELEEKNSELLQVRFIYNIYNYL